MFDGNKRQAKLRPKVAYPIFDCYGHIGYAVWLD